MEFDLLVFVICIIGGAGLVGLGVACYLALGDISDRFFSELASPASWTAAAYAPAQVATDAIVRCKLSLPFSIVSRQ